MLARPGGGSGIWRATSIRPSSRAASTASGNGDESARAALLDCAAGRLARLARKMLKGYPGVARWEQTDDVTQKALIRLDRAMREVARPTARDFFRLAVAQARRELIDLARHYQSPHGLGAHLGTLEGRGDSADGVAMAAESAETT
jgi:DNA-directed RNA polymerase specialized sigma24 family protein